MAAPPHTSPSQHQSARRVLIVGHTIIGLLTIALLGIIARVVHLQTQPPQPIRDLIGKQQSTDRLHGRRGNITDRHGRIIATTGLAQRLFVDPQLIKEPGTFSERVGYGLGYDPAWIERMIHQRFHSRYVVLDNELNEARVEKLSSLVLSGLATESTLVRKYPLGPLAGQVIGFVGAEGNGLEGIELAFDQALRASNGSLRYLRDVRRRPIWVHHDAYQPPSDGKPIRLTLDVMIQRFAEEELAQTCRQFAARTGQLIVIQPTTGQILAMGNYPPFDPNEFKDSQPDQRRNRCVTDVYEPGSTFKAIVWAAAANAGLLEPNKIVDCTESGVWISPKGRRLRDVRGHGRLSWDMVLVKSSNIGMAQLGLRLGVPQLHASILAFGFGRPRGSTLCGESPGIVNRVDSWNHFSLTSLPMGQEIAVTTLQMARAFAVIANSGMMMDSTICLSDRNDEVPINERIISDSSAARTRRVLRRVVTEGTGRKANSDLYTIFGKTGTAQVANPDGGGYLADQYVSSFIGAAPLDHPEVLAICVVDSPDKSIGYYGGTVAAPAVRRVIERSLLYMGIEPVPPGSDSSDAVALARILH